MSMTHLKVFCWISKEIFQMRRRPYTLCKFLLSKVSFTNKSFLSHAVICDWPVRIGRSFMGTIALAYRYE